MADILKYCKLYWVYIFFVIGNISEENSPSKSSEVF